MFINRFPLPFGHPPLKKGGIAKKAFFPLLQGGHGEAEGDHGFQ
jgi:hypothetical protein